MASQCDVCKKVVNGGGFDERESLTFFKSQFLLTPVDLPYYTRTLLPIESLWDVFPEALLRERID